MYVYTCVYNYTCIYIYTHIYIRSHFGSSPDSCRSALVAGCHVWPGEAAGSADEHMPHVYGVEARRSRRDRAAAGGYVRGLPPGTRAVAVPLQAVAQVRAMARSLELHRAHDELSKSCSHYARVATWAAASCGAISEVESRRAQEAHKAANVAKHGPSKRWRQPDPQGKMGGKSTEQGETSSSAEATGSSAQDESGEESGGSSSRSCPRKQ